MSDDRASDISSLKTEYSEAVRTAKRLGLAVRQDPMVYLACGGTRVDLAFLQGRILSVYERIVERLIELNEDGNNEHSGGSVTDLEFEQDVRVFRRALHAMKQ
jgi:hypothetical protein